MGSEMCIRDSVWTVLMTTCSPSVSTQVWVVCGEPSGINVVMKHGFRPRINSTKRSGRSTSMTLVQGSELPAGEASPMGRHKVRFCPTNPALFGDKVVVLACRRRRGPALAGIVDRSHDADGSR